MLAYRRVNAEKKKKRKQNSSKTSFDTFTENIKWDKKNNETNALLSPLKS